MISFKQFIAEDIGVFDFDKFKIECADMIDAYRATGKLLYHGMKVHNIPLITHDFKKDGQNITWANLKWKHRQHPRDTFISIHNVINQSFKKHFGEACRDWRFASTSKNQAEDYGHPFMLFPKGECNYVYSEYIEDIFVYLNSQYNIGNDVSDATVDLIDNLDLASHYEETTNAVKVLSFSAQFEVMFKCKDYYLIDTKQSEFLDKFMDVIS